jgi:glutamine amidotransferase
MCRWIAYIGEPIYMETLVTRPEHSLVRQSLNTKMRYKPDGSILSINGDGFGIGWYGKKSEPALYKVADPAWSNENLHAICAHTESGLFMAHIREATMGNVQRSNTHPFQYKNWIFQHNGHIGGFETINRELIFDIAPHLYPLVKGNTDSEAFFFLALTYGLEDNPKAAIEKTIGRVVQTAIQHGLPVDITLSIAFSDGQSLYTLRYSAGAEANSQFYSTHANCMKNINDGFSEIPTDSVVVVSEPLDFSYDDWEEMPKNSFSTIRNGKIQIEALDLQFKTPKTRQPS